MQSSQIMVLSAMTSMGLWVIAYVLIIRRGFLDKTYGMPFVALCPNLAYEFTYGFLEPLDPPIYIANIVWFFIDCVIAAQYLRYGWKEVEGEMPRWLFVARFFVVTTLWIFVALGLKKDLGLHVGNSYLGWGCQVILSGAYLSMLRSRKALEGQSLFIALARFLGSIVVIVAQEIEAGGLRVLWTSYAAFILLDGAYLGLYVQRCRSLGISPWKRV